jgi:hypothetical protein
MNEQQLQVDQLPDQYEYSERQLASPLYLLRLFALLLGLRLLELERD